MGNGKVYCVKNKNSIKWYNFLRRLHREDGPAVEGSDGRKEWWLNGKRYREDGPAVEYSNGTKEWFINGERHRLDGPAIEWSNGHKEWYLNDKRNREDGPAIEYADGTKEWWINGKQYSIEEYMELISEENRDKILFNLDIYR